MFIKAHKPLTPLVSIQYDAADGKHYKETLAFPASGFSSTKFADKMLLLLRISLKLTGFDGGYFRCTGTASLERFEGDKVVESISAPAIWELMFLGRTPKGTALD